MSKQKIQAKQRVKDPVLVCQECRAMCCKPLLYKQTFSLTLQVTDSVRFFQNNLTGVMALQERTPLPFMEEASLPVFLIFQHIFGYCPFLDFEQNKCTIYDKSYYPLTCIVFPYLSSPTPALENDCLLQTRLSKKLFRAKKQETQKRFDKYMLKELDNLAPFLKELIERGDFLGYDGDVITNHWGTFAIKSFNDHQPHELEGLFLLLNRYSQLLKVKKLYLRMRVIDRNFQMLHWITGIMHEEQPRSQQFMERKIQQQINDSYNHLHPTTILGVIFDDELQKYPRYWIECWKQRVKIWKEYRYSKRKK